MALSMPPRDESEFPLGEPIKIRITYDKTLQGLTGVSEYFSYASPGAPFILILDAIFTEHPIIQKTYPPGVLGFTLNGLAPDVHTPLNDGDVIHLLIPENFRPTLM